MKEKCRNKGQSVVEIALVIALLAIVAIVSLSNVGTQVKCILFMSRVAVGGGYDFSDTFGASSGDSNFQSGWDLNGDGLVNGGDWFIYRQHVQQCPWLANFL